MKFSLLGTSENSELLKEMKWREKREYKGGLIEQDTAADVVSCKAEREACLAEQQRKMTH